ncbi:MAG: uncharacterized membrane protein YbhN (UPF0104 family) [Patiriisocius sp.]|jgi:uncharacterized membrane protein YbhN (UPF0104 family)
MLRKLSKYLLSILVVGISFLYLYSLSKDNPNLMSTLITDIPFIIVILAILLSTLGGIANSLVWFNINKKFTPDTTFYISYYAWSVSRIFRYIPGKAIGFLVRQKLQKTSVKNGIKSSLNEIILTLLTIFFLSSFFFLNNIESDNYSELLILCIAFYTLIIFIKPLSLIIEVFLNYICFSIKINQLFSNPKILFKQSFLGLPALLLHGASFYLLLKYGFTIETIGFLFTTVALFLSGIIGQLALISPGGIGVREAALAFLMTNYGLSTEIALSAALASRVILLFSEMLNLLIAYIIKQAYEKS